jgi:hypothetical protein
MMGENGANSGVKQYAAELRLATAGARKTTTIKRNKDILDPIANWRGA